MSAVKFNHLIGSPTQVVELALLNEKMKDAIKNSKKWSRCMGSDFLSWYNRQRKNNYRNTAKKLTYELAGKSTWKISSVWCTKT
jgi:hypothetical protein